MPATDGSTIRPGGGATARNRGLEPVNPLLSGSEVWAPDTESEYEILLPLTPMPQNDVFRFGNFELLPESGELRKAGVKIRLQGKPLQVLKALINRPGGVVTRDELREKLWSADTFVDFESGLNTAANRLRNALGDSAESPIYIETLPRIGYRFIAPVTRVRYAAAGSQTADSGLRPLAIESGGRIAAIAPPIAVEVAKQPVKELPRQRRWLWITAPVIVILAAATFAAIRYGLRPAPVFTDSATFQKVTLQSGYVSAARFSPDGKRIIYSAAWGDDPERLYVTDGLGPNARDLGYGEAVLQSISPSGSLTFWSRATPDSFLTLGEANVLGGEAHTLGRDLRAVDYGPNGALCFVTHKASGASIEFPPGHVIYRTAGMITYARVSPDGKAVAFIQHPVPSDDAGDIMVVGADGKARVLSGGWGSAVGLSWNATGAEVWFTAARYGTSHEVMATDLNGQTRRIARTAGSFQLEDATHAGSVLVIRNTERVSMTVADLKTGTIKSVSRFDWTRPVAMSGDGSSILFDESGEGGGRRYAVFLYRTGTGEFSRLGEGRAMDLSPDGAWALSQDVDDASKLSLISTKTKAVTRVSGNGLTYHWVKFLPGNREILASGNYPGTPAAVYRQSLPNGTPTRLASLPDFSWPRIDKSGTEAVAFLNDRVVLVHLDTNKVDTLPKVAQRISPVAVLGPTEILVRTPDRGHLSLAVLEPATGKLRPHKKVADPSAGSGLFPVSISDDLRVAVYTHLATLSELFVVKGWR